MAPKPLPAAKRISIKLLLSRLGRGLLAVLLSLLVMTSVLAQDPTTPRRVGILMSGLAADPATRNVLQALVDGLRERGWQEGRNVMLEARYAGPDPARFPELARSSWHSKSMLSRPLTRKRLTPRDATPQRYPSSWLGLRIL